MAATAPFPSDYVHGGPSSTASLQVSLDLDGSGESTINTGIGFLDHMLTALAKHARFNLTLTCTVQRQPREAP